MFLTRKSVEWFYFRKYCGRSIKRRMLRMENVFSIPQVIFQWYFFSFGNLMLCRGIKMQLSFVKRIIYSSEITRDNFLPRPVMKSLFLLIGIDWTGKVWSRKCPFELFSFQKFQKCVIKGLKVKAMITAIVGGNV